MCAEQRDDIIEQLSAYLDGELSEQEVSRIERQLETDPQSRRLLEELAKTAEWVRDLPAESAPAGLRESTVAMLERDMLLGAAGEEAGGLPRPSRPVLRWLATAAVVALACTAGYFTLSQAGRGPSAGDEGSTIQTVRVGPEKSLPEQGGPEAEVRLGESDATARRSWGEAKKDSADKDVAGTRMPSLGRPDEEAEGLGIVSEPPAADVFDESRGKGPLSLSKGRGKGPVAQNERGSVASATDAVPEYLRSGAKPRKDEPGKGAKSALAPPQRAGWRVAAAHPVRLDVEVDSPARMYAMAGRARSTAAAGGWEMLDAAPAFAAMGRMQPVPEAAEVQLPEPGRGSARGRSRAEQPPAVRRLVLRGHRSQFVRLIEELRGQDQQARVQLISEQNVVSSGWPQVAAAAGRVGSLGVPGQLSPRPDFDDGRLPGVFDAPSAVNRMTTRAEQTPPSVSPLEGSARKDAAAEGRAERDEHVVLRQLTDAADVLDKAAGYEPEAASGRRTAERKGEADHVASRPGAEASGQPDSTQAQGSGLADSLLAMMQQIDATLDPDPVVEVTLTIRAVRLDAPPAPASDDIEPPPSLRLDGSADD
jgi:hypothetical protein